MATLYNEDVEMLVQKSTHVSCQLNCYFSFTNHDSRFTIFDLRRQYSQTSAAFCFKNAWWSYFFIPSYMVPVMIWVERIWETQTIRFCTTVLWYVHDAQNQKKGPLAPRLNQVQTSHFRKFSSIGQKPSSVRGQLPNVFITKLFVQLSYLSSGTSC